MADMNGAVDSDSWEMLTQYSFSSGNFQLAGLQYPLPLGRGAECNSHNAPHADDSDLECGDVAIVFQSDGSVQNSGFNISYKLVTPPPPAPPAPLAPPPITDCVGTPVRLSIVSGEHDLDTFLVTIEDESDVALITYGSASLGAQFPDDSVRPLRVQRSTREEEHAHARSSVLSCGMLMGVCLCVHPPGHVLLHHDLCGGRPVRHLDGCPAERLRVVQRRVSRPPPRDRPSYIPL